MFTPIGATGPEGRQFNSAWRRLNISNDNDQTSVANGNFGYDPRNVLDDDDELSEYGTENEITYSGDELEDGHSAVPRRASSFIREHQEQALQLVEAIEARVEELEECVFTLEEEKRRASEDRRLHEERISELEATIEFNRSNLDIWDEEIRARDAWCQRHIEKLEQQLSNLNREKTAPSRKVGTSSKNAPASANLHKQVVEDLEKEKLVLVKKMEKKREESEAIAKKEAAQLQSTIVGLEKEKNMLGYRLDIARQNSGPRHSGTVSAKDVSDVRAQVARLQETVRNQQAVIEQQEQVIEDYAQEEAQAGDYYDASDESVSESLIPPQEELDGLGLRSATAEEPEEDDAKSSASDTNQPEVEQPKLEADKDTLRQQCQELDVMNRDLKEQDRKWRKLFKRFMQRAANVQRKDASMHQIKKGFKDLHKIVKEGELQGL